jgi:hypothetical protein
MSSSSTVQKYEYLAGEYNDLLFNILAGFIDYLHTNIEMAGIRKDYSLRVIGSTGLVLARKILGISSSNYEYLHTIVKGEETYSKIRDWDIMIECETHHEDLVLKIIHEFFHTKPKRVSSEDYHTVHLKGINNIISYNIPIFNTSTEDKISSHINKFILKKFEQLYLKLDIIFVSSFESLKIIPSNLARNIFVASNGCDDMKIGIFSENFSSIKHYTEHTLISMIESISCYKHFITNVPEHTNGGDFYSESMFIDKQKKLMEFKKLDLFSCLFKQETYNKIAKFVLEGNDLMLCNYLKPKIIKLDALLSSQELFDKVNLKTPIEDVLSTCCAFCMEEFNLESYVHISSCGHMFHACCMFENIKKYYINLLYAAKSKLRYMIGENMENKMRCPVCRHDEWTIPIPSIIVEDGNDYQVSCIKSFFN